jgi:phosphoribosylformylglycinamidine (FGAM) synthase-like enzyme
VGGVDNFCWPNIQYHPEKNPDGKFKAAQLVRSCRALKDMCLAYGIPLLSGKDSMYVDGHLPGRYGETHKVSALETLVPKVVDPEGFCHCYRPLAGAVKKGLLASCHGIYRGGLAVHLALVAMGGELGLTVDLAKVPSEGVDRDDTLLFSESAGRFIVTVVPDNQAAFEAVCRTAGGLCGRGDRSAAIENYRLGRIDNLPIDR